jgi:hypothetical protein
LFQVSRLIISMREMASLLLIALKLRVRNPRQQSCYWNKRLTKPRLLDLLPILQTWKTRHQMFSKHILITTIPAITTQILSRFKIFQRSAMEATDRQDSTHVLKAARIISMMITRMSTSSTLDQTVPI